MTTEFNKEDLVFPFDTLQDKMKDIEKIYLEDYGSKYKNSIKLRQKNTIYLLNSTPDFEYDYLTKYNLLPKIDEEAFTTEYEDFMTLKQKITTQKNNLIYLTLCKAFNIDPKQYQDKLEEIISLPIALYGSNATYYSNNADIKVLALENLSAKKEAYLAKCQELKIKPLTYPDIIDKLQQQINSYELQAYNDLLLNSKYIADIQEYINNTLEINYNIQSLVQIHTYPASCSYFYTPGPNIMRLVYVPLIKIFEEGYSVDAFFLHENRHCIETGLKGIGLEKLDTSFPYHILNEIRTEKHALEDLNRLPTIFKKAGKSSGYKNYITLINELIDANSLLFDDSAFNNCPELLELFFTKPSLEELETSLSNLYNDVNSFKNPHLIPHLKIDKTSLDIKCQILQKQALEHSVKRFQKILKKVNSKEE